MSRYKHGDEVVHEYKGFQYKPEDDIEEDNVKRFHDVYIDGSRIFGGGIPMSPYSSVCQQTFERWIDMGCPTRSDMGGHQPKHHEEHYQNWVTAELEKELEL